MASLYERNKALRNRVSSSDFSLSKETIDQAWESGGQRQLDIVSDYRKKQEEEEKKSVTTRFGGSSISAPKPELTLLSTPTKTRGELLIEQAEENQRSMGAPIRNFVRNELGSLGKFFFGESEEKFRGHVLNEPDPDMGFIDSIRKDINTRGIIRQFVQASFKEDKEKIQEGSFDLVKQGYGRSEAISLATSFYEQGEDTVPENVSIALKDNDTKTIAWSAVEMLDTYPAFRALSRTGGKTFMRETFTAAMAAEDAVQSRKILVEAFPQLKGTQELEELISYSRTMADPQKSEQFLSEVMKVTTPSSVRSTEAQRVFYQNGIPIVRGGDIASETVRRGDIDIPSQTKDALVLRREINDVIAGEAEGARLSNLDVFADEIKAGSIPFKASVDDQIEMFVSDAIQDASRLRAGDRLSTSKEVLEETLEKGKAKTIKVSPDQVVRLSDGTFVYAPKDQLGKGMQATLRGLRESQRAKVARIERQKAVSTLKKQLDSETQRFNASVAKREAAKRSEVEKLNREVAEEAEFFNQTLARREQAAQAQKIVDEQAGKTKRLIDDIDESAKAREKEIRAKAKEVNKAVRTARDKVDDAIDSLGKIDKAISRERNTARTEIKKINALTSRVSSKEKAKRRAKVIKERDKEIARLTKEKKKLNENLPKLRAALIKAKSEVFDKDAAIKKLTSEAVAQKASLRKDSQAAISKARDVVKETSKLLPEPKTTTAPAKPKPKTPAQKARVKNAEEATTLATAVKESFTVTAKEIPDTVGTPLNPVKSEGKTVENQIIQGLQDEVETIRKNFEERGLSLADLPDTHQAISNTTLMKQAFADLVEDPAKVYSDFISGALPEGTTRAAYALALMKSDFVLQNPARMDMVARAFYKGNTRIAQELQSIKVFGRMDYLNIVGRFSAQADEILKARRVDIEAEASKLLKRFNDEFDDLPPMSKAEAKTALDSVTCPV